MGGSMHILNIGDIPVRVSSWFGLLLIYWFWVYDDKVDAAMWAGVVTLSILVHELGHAMVARYYRLRPQILLHGLGGLCFHERAEKDIHDVWIIAAGPGAGLVLGGITLVVSIAAGGWLEAAGHYWALEVIRMSLWVNIGWSIVNLLPIWPLDGGQLFRLFMLRVAKPKLADRVTHIVALLLLAVGLYVGRDSAFLALLIIWIGFANIQALSGERSSGVVRAVNKHSKLLLKKAEEAYAGQDFREAARICQQIRGEQNVPDGVLKRVWTILGVSAARNGDHEEALSFLQHAKPSQAVTEANIECLYALGRDDELQALLKSAAFAQIPEQRRSEILEVIQQGE